MKNLKINKKRISALLGAVLVTTNLTACSFSQSKGPEKELYVTEDSVLDTNNLQYLVIVENGVEKIVPITSLKLVNSKNEIVEKVDGVIVDGKIMNISNPVEIKFSMDIEKVVINNEILPVSEFTLVNSDTLEKLTNIVGMYANYEYTDLSQNPLFNNNRLTEEKFNELVESIYKKYSDAKLDVSKEEVRDFLMLVNIDKIATDNKELVDIIVGDRNVDSVILSAFNVYSAVMNENIDRYCVKGLDFDSVIIVSDTVFDNHEKETVLNIEKRIKEIVLAKNDKEEFNKLVNSLLKDMGDSKKDEFNMDSGVGYSVMTILINFIRVNFYNDLDKTNSELVKCFVTFASDEEEYKENSIMNAYNKGIYAIMSECISEQVYTKTN